MKFGKQMSSTLKKHSGRNASGKVTVRHQGGRAGQRMREIDWHRGKFNIPAIVEAIEKDPLRTGLIALLKYSDGERRYILSPVGLKVGDKVISGPQAEARLGNCLPMTNIPIGTPIHNIELTPGKGAQMVRSAGSQAVILAKEAGFGNIRFPSGEVRRILLECYATVGQVSNIDWKNEQVGKAGRNRWRGIRPTVRGVAQNPHSHPHGGGEGRSGIGMPSPKSPWGKKALGKKTRESRKYSDKMMIKRIN